MSRITSIIIITLVFGSVAFIGAAGQAQAYQLTPRITFTFDDGSKTIYENALPVLSSHNIPAVLFGETGPLNSGEDWMMTWDQIRDLQNTYNWEIGSHAITHSYLTQISDSQVTQELLGAKQDFAAQGIDAKAFATPYGDYNIKILSEIAKYYQSHRAAWGGSNQWPSPYNDYEIVSQEASFDTTPETVKSWIDQAIANNQWLVILLHGIVEGTPNPYEYNVDDFAQIVDYAANSPIEVVTITEALNYSDQPNLIQNFTFSQLDGSGWANNWTRTNESQVTVDTSNHGNVYGPQNSLKIVAGVQQHEAQTDIIEIDSSQEYLLRMYHNVQNLVAGGSAVWINEFDTVGAWLGGQWLGGTYANFVGYRYYEYNPSSATVAKVKIHIFTEENSQLTLYVDSVELKSLSDIEPAPFCGDGNVDPGEECDDGNTNNSDICSNVCAYNMIEAPIQTCTGQGELFLYQAEPFQSVDTSFTTQRDQLLMFTNGLTDFEIKVNNVVTIPTIVTEVGSKVYSIETIPGDLISVTSLVPNSARNVQAYLAQDLASPVYDSASLEIAFVHQDQQTDNLYLSAGTYNYLYMDKHTENAQGTPDNREMRVQIEGPIGMIIDRLYTLPYPQPSEGVVIDSYVIAPGQAGNYAITMSADDSIYWPLASCSEQIEILGCTDLAANNFNPEVTVDDGSCTYDEPEPICGNNILEEPEQCDDGNLIDGDGCSAICEIEVPVEIEGCTDPAANNFNPEATTDDGSCTYDEPNSNLVANPSFEELDNDWASNWTYLDPNVSIDTNNNGASPYPQNSLKIVAGSNQRVVVSDLIQISGIKTYQLSYFQNLANFVSGGTATWIDEFDESDNWLSGAWLGGTYASFNGIKTLDYLPTSASISQIQIHLFTETSSSMTLYIDSVELIEK